MEALGKFSFGCYLRFSLSCVEKEKQTPEFGVSGTTFRDINMVAETSKGTTRFRLRVFFSFSSFFVNNVTLPSFLPRAFLLSASHIAVSHCFR